MDFLSVSQFRISCMIYLVDNPVKKINDYNSSFTATIHLQTRHMLAFSVYIYTSLEAGSDIQNLK